MIFEKCLAVLKIQIVSNLFRVKGVGRHSIYLSDACFSIGILHKRCQSRVLLFLIYHVFIYVCVHVCMYVHVHTGVSGGQKGCLIPRS